MPPSPLWSVPVTELDSDLDREQLRRQSDLDIARRTIHGVGAAPICFLILIVASSYFKDHPVVVTVAGSCIASVLLFRIYVSRQVGLSERPWRTLYYSTVGMSGACWGVFHAATVWLYGIYHPTALLFLACMVTICSAVPVSLAPNLRIMFAFLCAAVIPSIAIYGILGGSPGWTMAVGATAFLLFSLIQGINRNREYWNGLYAAALLKRREEERNEVELALRRAHEHLEEKIKERTAELMAANLVLKAQKEDLAMLFEQATDCVLVTNYDAVLLEINASGCAMTGYSRQELVGGSVFKLLSPADGILMQPVLEEVQTGKAVLRETRITTKNGNVVPIEFSALMLSDHRLMAFVRDITKRKKAEEAASLAQREVRDLSGRIIRLQDAERRRLARELHDTTAQNLFALGMKLDMIISDTLDDRLRGVLVESAKLAEQCLSEVRTFSYVLYPPMLDDVGLSSALSWYVKEFMDRSGVQVRLDVPPTLGRLPQDVEMTLYRVVQESLTNIYRHSGSPTAYIRITPNSANIELEVADKGHGAPGKASTEKCELERPTGVGIASMRERVRKLGGQFEILSGQEGTTVRVTLPLSRKIEAVVPPNPR